VKRDDLYRLLDQRNREGARAGDIDQRVWEECGCERAVLVTDLTGFTCITKREGILHFLAQFRRVVCTAEPLFAKAGATFWKMEADDLMASFPSVQAALEVGKVLAETDFGEVAVCAGVAWGRILQFDDDLFGDAVNVAYKLGEDTAKAGEVLLDENAAAQVPERVEGPLLAETGGIELPYFVLRKD
jgi:class 3 adenylate cyclase